eukprot:750203-Hanusia_phi.AAC.2
MSEMECLSDGSSRGSFANICCSRSSRRSDLLALSLPSGSQAERRDVSSPPAGSRAPVAPCSGLPSAFAVSA